MFADLYFGVGIKETYDSQESLQRCRGCLSTVGERRARRNPGVNKYGSYYHTCNNRFRDYNKEGYIWNPIGIYWFRFRFRDFFPIIITPSGNFRDPEKASRNILVKTKLSSQMIGFQKEIVGKLFTGEIVVISINMCIMIMMIIIIIIIIIILLS